MGRSFTGIRVIGLGDFRLKVLGLRVLVFFTGL